MVGIPPEAYQVKAAEATELEAFPVAVHQNTSVRFKEAHLLLLVGRRREVAMGRKKERKKDTGNVGHECGKYGDHSGGLQCRHTVHAGHPCIQPHSLQGPSTAPMPLPAATSRHQPSQGRGTWKAGAI
ncbi:hypothetical protein E4U09_004499 [Claviceps aff. purpurea]|uniref:Uncharacterized protein n=1 Tax=Claviceps aff. purpurea TaxID=1967640 RepID=A0A9P7U4I5_9HYPO|nr:hypothetical protein E4U09_004499 [Claviceps aff. purpurea]